MRPDLTHFTRTLTRMPRQPAVGDIAQQLRELPAEAAPPYDFAEFRRRSHERSAPKRHLVSWPHAAAAAGLTAVVAAMALLGTRGGSGPNDEPGPASGSPVTATVVPRNTATFPAGTAAENSNSAAQTVARIAGSNTATPPAGASAIDGNDEPSDPAHAAREWLARQPAEPALVRAGPRLTVTGLEDRIAWFDDALTDRRLHGANPTQLKVLQQERARLVSSLAQVRFAEALVANGS
jgi:hypothetical protein